MAAELQKLQCEVTTADARHMHSKAVLERELICVACGRRKTEAGKRYADTGMHKWFVGVRVCAIVFTCVRICLFDTDKKRHT